MSKGYCLGYIFAMLMVFGMTTAGIYAYYSVITEYTFGTVMAILAFLIQFSLFGDWLVLKEYL